MKDKIPETLIEILSLNQVFPNEADAKTHFVSAYPYKLKRNINLKEVFIGESDSY